MAFILSAPFLTILPPNKTLTTKFTTPTSLIITVPKNKPPSVKISLFTSDDVADKGPTLRDLCKSHVPANVLNRMEEVGFIMPTDVQQQALPVLLSGCDCIMHAQTGSGKTLAYLLAIYSVINTGKSVQALIVVPTRELGMQVTKVARLLTGSVMTLLDGGTLTRQKSWLKAEPPSIVVATLGSLCRMLEKRSFKLDLLKVLVVDEVDALFNSPKEVSSLRKLLTSYSSKNNRQTIFASASIPQHKRFLSNCIQEKWTKDNIVHVHVNAAQPIPLRLHHRFVICSKDERLHILQSLLERDAPQSAIIFATEQSEKSKMAGEAPPTSLLIAYLKSFDTSCFDILLLEEDMNINSRAASLSEMRRGGRFLLVATDLASRGVDLPETTHIYNYDLPKCAVDYLHRAGRTCRRPFSEKIYYVTSILTSKERFVLQRFENELKFCCEEMFL